jgi:hypothetical protein
MAISSVFLLGMVFLRFRTDVGTLTRSRKVLFLIGSIGSAVSTVVLLIFLLHAHKAAREATPVDLDRMYPVLWMLGFSLLAPFLPFSEGVCQDCCFLLPDLLQPSLGTSRLWQSVLELKRRYDADRLRLRLRVKFCAFGCFNRVPLYYFGVPRFHLLQRSDHLRFRVLTPRHASPPGLCLSQSVKIIFRSMRI